MERGIERWKESEREMDGERKHFSNSSKTEVLKKKKRKEKS